MAMEQYRHDMSDRAWEKIRPYTIGEKGHAEEMPVIPGSLSTVYSGAFVPEHLGGTCQKRTETGRRYTAGFAGAILYQFWYHSGLHNYSATDCGIPGRVPSGIPGL